MTDEAELDRRIARALEQQRAERDANPVADTTLFLSHHWPARYDRCAIVAGRHVCRRCLVLYPVAIGVALLAGFGIRWPDSWDVWMFWLLPIPGVVEFSLDALGLIRHRPWRQVVVSAMLAVAYGKILWRYSHHPGDGLVWAVVLVNTATCGVAAIIGSLLGGRRERRTPSPTGDGGVDTLGSDG
ncbi:MAG: hypothetical protein JST73_10910 [Actinobacteria bacterium]|nr:hypothetical protein [Actinomycetota bacterium]